MAEVFLAQPCRSPQAAKGLLVNDDLFKRTASKDKHVHVLQGSSHGKTV
jgi:hypothetical protein